MKRKRDADNEGEQDVHRDARYEYQKPRRQRLALEESMLRNGQRSEGHHGVRIVIRTLRAWRRLGTALEQGRVFVESRGHPDVAA